jgi:hypothetical protein
MWGFSFLASLCFPDYTVFILVSVDTENKKCVVFTLKKLAKKVLQKNQKFNGLKMVFIASK